jgi:rSAM/selenodomain-associated transferase 2
MSSGISVIIPTWNEAVALPRLLDSLAACRPVPDEVLVADCGSSDGTVTIARERATLVAATAGRGEQQNAGAGAASGEILWFLHADCAPPPSATAEILAAIALGAAGGCFRIALLVEERVRHPLLPAIERGINARTRWTRTGTGDQGIFVRRELFRQAGGFPPWPLFEDVALFSHIAALGRMEICKGPLVTSARRWLAGGPARTMALMWGLRLGYLAGVPASQLAGHWPSTSGA